jgi:hypothetical protein
MIPTQLSCCDHMYRHRHERMLHEAAGL